MIRPGCPVLNFQPDPTAGNFSQTGHDNGRIVVLQLVFGPRGKADVTDLIERRIFRFKDNLFAETIVSFETLEMHRVDALRDYGLLSAVRDGAVADLVKLSAITCNTPIALVNIIDDQHQHTIEARGAECGSIPREHSVCAHLLLSPGEILVVPDLQQDERFSPDAMGRPADALRGYAGVPLVTPDGYVLGALCVCDTEARQFSDVELESLQVIGQQVMQTFEVRRIRARCLELESLLEREFDSKPF